jgi:hypothetical protein
VERLPRLNNNAIFPIAFAGAVAAALTVPLWMLTNGASVLVAATAFCFGFPAFLVALLFPVGLMNVVAPFASSRWVRWALVSVISAIIGFELPQIVGLMFPVPGKMGAVAGFIGGVVSAWAWGYFERHPEQAMMSGQGAKGDA